VDSWGAPTAPTYVLAGRGMRLVAYLLNGVFWVLPLVLGYLAAPAAWDDPQQVRDPVTGQMAAANERATLVFGSIMLAGWALVLIANAILVATRSQSLGKLLVGIEIRRTDGTDAGFWRIVGLRWFVTGLIGMGVPFFGLVDCGFIFRSDRRCVHDLLADTIVVVRDSGHGDPAPAPAPLPPLTEAARPVRACPTCGADAPAGAEFCPHCGNRLDAVPVAPGAGPSTPPDEETFQW
jgi:uncharacterized RDD family membrane protein YckC